jgi:Rrf2 family protein
MPCALKISEAASLAIHALGFLADRGEVPVTTRQIATRFQMSEAHLAKVLQRLIRVDLVRSIRGPKGGFLLTREPESVTLLEVFEAIEGPFEPSRCLLSGAICDGESCIIGKIVVEANTLLKQRLEETTLNQVGAVIRGEAPQVMGLDARRPTGTEG